jgi:hypothetical protein
VQRGGLDEKLHSDSRAAAGTLRFTFVVPRMKPTRPLQHFKRSVFVLLASKLIWRSSPPAMDCLMR